MPPEKGPPGEATARRIRLKAGRVRGALATLAMVSSVPFHFDPAYALPNAACRDRNVVDRSRHAVESRATVDAVFRTRQRAGKESCRRG